MSTLSVGTIKSTATTPPVIQNSSGTAIGTFCRAWVNFNGTGTVAIRSQFNVSSITDNGTGVYVVNFTNALPDANYTAICGSSNLSANQNVWSFGVSPYDANPTTTALSIRSWTPNSGAADVEFANVAIFR